ncbi:MAG: class I SAM-dependent methyltransferase [Clostridia bacterium]|nr:class I SAM-dependent methyltransferase [Clostridia bacterium]
MKYYEAYDRRYRTVHAEGLAWFGGGATPALTKLTARLPDGARVLELGCGEGADAMWLISQGYDVLATDVSPAAVDWCRARFPEVAGRFRVLDALADTLEDTFDGIVAVAVLHMLIEDADRQALLRFIREHLAPGGVGLIVVMGDGEAAFATEPARAFDEQERVHQASGRKLKIASTSCRVVSRETLREEFTRAGLWIADEGPAQWDGSDFAMYALVQQAGK